MRYCKFTQNNTPNLKNSWLKTDAGVLTRVKREVVEVLWRVILGSETLGMIILRILL
jgi:hypothetical protein